MMILALVTTKEKIIFFFMLLFRAHCRKYLFFQILQCHSLELVEALEKTTNMTEEELQQVVPPTWASEPSSLWSDLNENCWGRLLFTLSNNSWSCWQGVCNSWLLNVFPPHKLACRSPQVANCWASTQVELLNFWTIEEAHKSSPSFSAGSCLALLDAVLHGEVKQRPLSCCCVGQEIMVECGRWRIVRCPCRW